jgi:hypothetical protein
MGKTIGRDYDVAISLADSDASYVEIANIKTVTFDEAHDIADATDNDSGGRKEAEYADSQVNLSVTCNRDQSDTGQARVQLMSETKVKRYFRVRPKATTGERERIFRAVISAYSDTGTTGAISEMSFTVQSDGTPTFADQ